MNLFLLLVGLVSLAVGVFGVYHGRLQGRQRALMQGAETTDALRITPEPIASFLELDSTPGRPRGALVGARRHARLYLVAGAVVVVLGLALLVAGLAG